MIEATETSAAIRDSCQWVTPGDELQMTDARTFTIRVESPRLWTIDARLFGQFRLPPGGMAGVPGAGTCGSPWDDSWPAGVTEACVAEPLSTFSRALVKRAPSVPTRSGTTRTWETGLAEAQRSNRPIFFMAAAANCSGISGVF